MQYHERKDETSYVLSGTVKVTAGGNSITLTPGNCWRIKPGVVHTLKAVTDAVVIEVSTPHLDDVIRVADLYGRAAA